MWLSRASCAISIGWDRESFSNLNVKLSKVIYKADLVFEVKTLVWVRQIWTNFDSQSVQLGSEDLKTNWWEPYAISTKRSLSSQLLKYGEVRLEKEPVWKSISMAVWDYNGRLSWLFCKGRINRLKIKFHGYLYLHRWSWHILSNCQNLVASLN